MQVANSTRWNTKDITRLIYRVAQDELDQGKLKHAKIRIRYRRSNGGWGNCTYGTGISPRVNMMLGLPRAGIIDTVEIASIIAHELGHAKGIRHRDMHNSRYGFCGDWRERYAYASDFKIGAKPEKPKPSKEDARTKRRTDAVAKATDKVEKWERTTKRAAAMVQKWQKRLKSANKRLFADLPPEVAAIAVVPYEALLVIDEIATALAEPTFVFDLTVTPEPNLVSDVLATELVPDESPALNPELVSAA